MIIRSEHTFGAGEANTTLTTKWVAEIEAALDNTDEECTAATATGAGSGDTTECRTLLRRAGRWRNQRTP